MATVNIYLNFNGNCEKAFKFYQSVFGKEISYMGRYKDIPPADSDKMKLRAGDEEKIMHVSLPISKENILMGCDVSGESATAFLMGNNFSIFINVDSKDEANKLFKGLSARGTIIMPLSKTFWSECFGVVTDQFGINWTVSFDKSQQEQ